MYDNIQIIRSSRKTLSLEITKELQVIIRAPWRASRREIFRLIDEKSGWIDRNLAMMRERMEQRGQRAAKLSEQELRQLTEQARQVFSWRVAYFARQMQVSFGRIAIRHQKTRWGSCSQKGNLNFNCLLLLAPPEVLDYVVVHELCHRKEMNHSERFWQEVGRVLPDYREQRNWLRTHGRELMERVY